LCKNGSDSRAAYPDFAAICVTETIADPVAECVAVISGVDIVGFSKQEAAMEITFTGMDESDLEQQIWAWRANNPNLKMTKKHPIEMLPLSLSTPHSGQKIFAGHQVSLRVEYEEV
jgi:hypothetical protein